MEKKVTIQYNWSDAVGNEPKQSHQEALEESAMDRILYMMKDGYTSGELIDNVSMDDEDGDGIEYTGYWSITTETV